MRLSNVCSINFLSLLSVKLTQNDGSTVHQVQSIDTGHDNMTVDLTEATLGQDGQIIITGEDGQGSCRLFLKNKSQNTI